MRFITNISTDPYYNMALDEYCLEQYDCGETFFYLWRNRPSVIIGLNQNAYSEVNLAYLEDHDIRLARRVTGGGAVYHDLQNLNYSIVGRSVDAGIFASALRKLGLDAELTGRNDIFVGGRKVSGYARRVWKDREIIHGTLMYDVDIDTLTEALNVKGSKLEAKGIASVRSRVANVKELLPRFASLDDLQAELLAILSNGDAELPFADEQKAEVAKIAQQKFATWEWIYGHSHQADFVCSAKLPCGRVDAEISLDKGRIRELRFSGDFVGGVPAVKLENALKGLRYDEAEILNALQGEDVPSSFDATDASQLTRLIMNKY